MESKLLDRAIYGAHRYKLDGSGEGSAFRSHRYWVRRGPFVFVSGHHNWGDYWVLLLTEPEAEITPGSTDSCGYGNPDPKPSDGEAVRIWDRGSWKIEGPWQDDCERVLQLILRDVTDAERDERARLRTEKRDAAMRANQRSESLRQGYTKPDFLS